MIYQCKNWAFNDYPGYNPRKLPVPAEGDTFIMCNLVRYAPNTKIFQGIKKLKFLNCNLVNCDLPNDVEIHQSNTAQNVYEFEEMGKTP